MKEQTIQKRSSLNHDNFFEILYQSTPHDIKKLCSVNPDFNSLCKQYKSHIIKHFLNKYDVTESTFIYNYYTEKYGKSHNETYDLSKIFKIFLNFFNRSEILHDYDEPTHFPILPQLKTLNCNYSSNLLKLPLLQNLTKLNCDDCKLTTIPQLPNLKILIGTFTELTHLPELPNLIILNCFGSKVTHLPSYPLLQELRCGINKIESLNNEYPNLLTLFCENNRLHTLNIHAPKLTNLFCDNNLLTELPEFPLLQMLSCNNNLLTNLNYYINLSSLQTLYAYGNPLTQLIT